MVPATTQSFGSWLRRERERRQIALASISANSKISVSLFEALERDDVARWPVGIYRRAFIRAYATAIGLDADAVAREFLERYPDPSEPPAMPEAPAAAVVPPAARSRDARLRLTLADTGGSFSRGRILAGMRRRWAAAACDAGVVLAVALTMFAVVGRFWAPLSVTMLAYYLGGILLLGNTPGVCLLAMAPRPPSGKQGGNAGRGLAVKAGEILAQLRARAKSGPVGWWRGLTRV
jgi:transcriptional regulator with XRE-family HTH domain